MTGEQTVAQLRPGQSGTIVGLSGARAFRRRLMELGLLPGTEVRLVNRAPLGDPLELEVRGCRLSIRQGEAAHVGVRDVRAHVRHLKVVP